MKLKKEDNVKVIAGKDKGREGKIEKTLPKSDKVIVVGINIYKKHIKGNRGVKAGIYDIPRPIDVSKVMLVCPNCKKTTKIGYETSAKGGSSFGRKIRICKKCKKQI